MKKRRGFTLIELLAVIVILAVIALIAVPIVLNIIERARRGSAQSSANGLRKAAQFYYSSNLIENVNEGDITFTCDGKKCISTNGSMLEIDGTVPTSGIVEIKMNGEMVFSNIIINGYSCNIPKTGNSKCFKNGKNNVSDISIGEVTTTVNSIIIPYTLDNELSLNVSTNKEDLDGKVVPMSYNNLANKKANVALLEANSENVICEYGTDEQYGQYGIIENNSCYITGLDANTVYYYKLTVVRQDGEKIESKGSVGTHSYVPGEVVYFNPISGEPCYNYSNSNSNWKYIGQPEKASQNQCLKWNIVSYDNENHKINMLIDHNVTYNISWETAADPNSLSDIRSLWSGVDNIRQITADEIAEITGASSENTLKWNSSKKGKLLEDETLDVNADLDTEVSWYSLNGSGKTYNKSENGWQVVNKLNGVSKVGWLYENTEDCVSYGCMYEDTNSSFAYWTETPINIVNKYTKMWVITNHGVLATAYSTVDGLLGIRPVVTIDEKKLTIKGNQNNVGFINKKPDIKAYDVYMKDSQIIVNIDSDVSLRQILCEYGENGKYTNSVEASLGATIGLEDGKSYNYCTMENLSDNTKYDYKITVTDKFYNSSIVTGDFIFKSETTDTPKEDETKNLVQLGGYNWHIIEETANDITLLMDANQLGDYNQMSHCSSSNDESNNCTYNGSYYTYSWSDSLIRKYLNGQFLNDLESKIDKEIITIPICADASREDGEASYGGYLVSDLRTGQTCSSIVNDKVRLLSWNETSYAKIDTDEEIWMWTMASYPDKFGGTKATEHVRLSLGVTSKGASGYREGGNNYLVRPVITIAK